MASTRRTWTGLDASAIPLLYTAIERAALAKYLDFTDPAPTELAGIDLSETVDPDEWDQDELGIAPLASTVGSDSLMLQNVVARICLESVQHKLPQWASVSEGRVTLARRISKRRQIIRDLQPRYLFEINWADSGPGFSWPEKYHVTYLPGYDISVVTASADGPDAHGYADFAIGWFPGAELREEEARRCVTGWWTEQRGWGQERWAYLFGTGSIDEDTATAWALEVWGKEAEDEEGAAEQEDADVDR